MKSIFIKGAGQGRLCVFFTALAAGCFYFVATTKDETPQALATMFGGFFTIGALGNFSEKCDDPSGKKYRDRSNTTLGA